MATMAHAHAISNALQCLEDEAITAPGLMPLPPGLLSPDVDVEVKKTEKEVDGGHTKPEEPPTLSHDPSVVVLSALGEEGTEGEKEGGNKPWQPGDMFRAEDIKISVIRPSPVKEVPKQGVLDKAGTEGQVEGKVEIGVAKDDLSERSSGSSIQVIDDKDHNIDTVSSESTRPDLTRQQAMMGSFDSELSRQMSDDVFKDDAEKTRGSEAKDSLASQGDTPSKEEDRLPDFPGTVKATDNLDHAASQAEASRKEDEHVLEFPPKALRGNKSVSDATQLYTEGDKSVPSSGIKRAHSSASFEKYKSEKPKFYQSTSSGEPRTPSTSGIMTPQRRSSGGHHTPSKMTLASGLNTPLSTIETGSRSSAFFDDGKTNA